MTDATTEGHETICMISLNNLTYKPQTLANVK